MGYGEFGGGGSLYWKVIQGGDGGVHSGRDPEPKREIITGKYKGKFVVVINGKETAYDITGKQDQIQIYWPPHKPGQIQDLREVINALNRRTAATSGRRAAKSRRKKG
jgi:hypothetical protein